MKFSFRQILASTAGAVIAAIIASTFGVKGTIVGVAIGSAAATMATAFVAQSIERGHEAVKQVVVKAPETSTLLRRLGGTGASGDTDTHASSAPTEVVRRGRRTIAPPTWHRRPPPWRETVEISAVTDAPATERLQATTRPVHLRSVGRGITWRAIAGTAVIVFVLALLFITAIELISGKPLSTHLRRVRCGNLCEEPLLAGPGARDHTDEHDDSTTRPTNTSSTTATSSTTTTTTSAATTTSTSAPSGNVTTTTSPAPTGTSTTVVTGGPPTSSSAP